VSLPEHRAGDADRERVASILRDAHVEGRLDADELDARLDATYRAKTFGELAGITADLPAPRARSRPPGSEPAVPSSSLPARGGDSGMRAAWATWATAVSINVVIWMIVSITSAELVYFWPMWVAGPWGAVLLVTSLARSGGRR
jgi:hypothetical protein